MPSPCYAVSASVPPQLSRRLRADERCSKGKEGDLSHRGKRDLALFCGCLSKEEGKNEGNRDGPEVVIRMEGYLLFCQLTHHAAESLKHVLITCSDRRRQSALGILQRHFPPNHTSSKAPHLHPILGLALPIILPPSCLLLDLPTVCASKSAAAATDPSMLSFRSACLFWG